MNKGHVWSIAAAMTVVLWGGEGAFAQYWSAGGPEASATPAKSSLTSQAGAALVQGRPDEALAKADAAIRSEPHLGWAHYARAEALTALKRNNEAVSAYESAAGQLPASNTQGRALALWGRASALRAAGRCGEARTAYDSYVGMVRNSDPAAATQARAQAEACRSTLEAPAAPSTAARSSEPPRALEPPRAPQPAGAPEPTSVPRPATARPVLTPPPAPLAPPGSPIEPPPIPNLIPIKR